MAQEVERFLPIHTLLLQQPLIGGQELLQQLECFLLLEKDRDPQSLLPSSTPELIAVDIICIKTSSPAADYGPDRSLGLSARRTRRRRPGSLNSTTDCTETNSDGQPRLAVAWGNGLRGLGADEHREPDREEWY